MGHSKRSSKREVCSKEAYLKKQEKSQKNTPNLSFKGILKKEQIKPKVSRRKETIRIREEAKSILMFLRVYSFPDSFYIYDL